MSSDIAIKVEGLSKCYQIYDQPHDRLKQFILPRLQGAVGQQPKQYYREFWALKDVSFEVKKGETVGIIGRNGSGKSTLLQMICGTLSPTAGRIFTHGRIAALLELGSGFNLEFTGRENVYLNASLLGLAKEEIDQAYEAIVAFADIGAFINQPIKTYSSGMIVRLAFAVQAQVSPSIMIVDEALAVGDAKFQSKCFERLRQLKEGGTSILLVTHSSEQIVTHCSSAVLLNQGMQLEKGKPRHVVNRYMDLLFGKEKVNIKPELSQEVAITPFNKNNSPLSTERDMFSQHNGYNHFEYRWGDGAATILDFCLEADGEQYPSVVNTGQTIDLTLSIKFNQDLCRPILGLTIKTKEGVIVYGANSETLDGVDFCGFGNEGSIVEVKASFPCRLASGDYFISIGIATKNGEDVIPHDRRYDCLHLHVHPDNTFFGLVNLDLNLSATRFSEL
jgi:lipopolysaccharide transport system ATP-binding protein